MKFLTSLAVLMTMGTILHAELSCAPVFQDGAILQQGVPVPIWGKADAGSQIRVSFADQALSTQADELGDWKIELRAMKADRLEDLATAPAGRELVVSSGGQSLSFNRILIGEVWLCAGQSNMAGKVKNNRANADPKDDLTKLNLPAIRHYHSETGWIAATEGDVMQITKVGLTFARKIQKQLKVPIGLLNATRGGSAIESWIRPSDGPFEEAAGRRQRPIGGLYTSSLQPLIGTAMKGALWYQGEANAGDGYGYYDKLKTLIAGWREQWGQGDFPFLVVQLAGIGESNPNNPVMGDGRAAIREAQFQAMKQIPNVGLATAVEIGGPKEHPPNKTDIGKRLAHWALHHQYQREITASGPIYLGYQVRCSSIAIRFENAKGLCFADKNEGYGAPVVCKDGSELPWISIQDAQGVWHWATAWVEGDELLVNHPSVKKPKAVRYAFTNRPKGPYLYNRAGLPAFPFTTEKWEDLVEEEAQR